jgi:hypothetical protein
VLNIHIVSIVVYRYNLRGDRNDLNYFEEATTKRTTTTTTTRKTTTTTRTTTARTFPPKKSTVPRYYKNRKEVSQLPPHS